MTIGQRLEIGPFSFTVIRLLILIGVFRVLVRGEMPLGGFSKPDLILCLWAAVGLIASLFHKQPLSQLVTLLGISFESLGIYFLCRCFIRGQEDLTQIAVYVLLLLTPVALEMVYEKATGRNLFAVFGYVAEQIALRGGKLRAQGPFAHAILAGTVGAVCLPLAAVVYRHNRYIAIIGAAACLTIILTSASSGPILTSMAIYAALIAKRWRSRLYLLKWFILVGVVALDIVMNDPFYFVLARIDLTGSSTGWHRAALIRASIEHFNEWWLYGTDVTRHWMPTGVAWSEKHTDITNHYLKMGVYGGILYMFLFIAMLRACFVEVGHAVRYLQLPKERWNAWVLGSILFGHVITFFSISYFDQTLVFFYLLLAAIVSIGIAARWAWNPASLAAVSGVKR